MTRTLKITALALFSVLILWACGGGGASSPSDVAKSFLEAVEVQDWSKAKEFSTDKTKDELDKLASVAKEPAKRAVAITGETIDGESATVKYTLDGGEEKTLALVKDGDSWKAETTKMDLSGDGGTGLDGLNESLEGALDELGDELNEAADEMEGGDHEGHDHE